jgi:hypothetical protein
LWASNPLTSAVTDLAVDPSNGSVMWATGASQGVVRSTNGGSSWTPFGLDPTLLAQSVAVDPANPRRVYVGTFAGVYQIDVTPPTAVTGGASGVSSTGATLGGTVNPLNLPTSYVVEYGTTTAYGRTTPAVSAGSGNTATAVSQTVTGLAPGTTYHFRVVATSDGGVAAGADQTLTTAAAASPPPGASPPPPGASTPRLTPRVRFRIALGPKAQVLSLTVLNVPRGSRVDIRCRRGCKVSRVTVATKRTVSFSTLFRRQKLAVGTTIEIRVTRPGAIGRYFRYRIGERRVVGVECPISTAGKLLRCSAA